MSDLTPIPAAELKRAFGSFPTGVTVMTTLDADGAPVGMTASSFNTVSMDPPLILWSIRLDSQKRAAFNANDRFAVNVLSADQSGACYGFARPEGAAFDSHAWRPGTAGIPLLDEAAAHMECRVWSRHEAGDHEILIGEITSLGVREAEPMVFYAGRLCQISNQATTGS